MRSSHRQDFRTAIHLFDFASHPVNRRSASQFDYALPRALAGSSVERLLPVFRRRERVRCRSQLYVPRIFTWISGPRYAAMQSFSSSKPIAPSEQSSERSTYGSPCAGQERCKVSRRGRETKPRDTLITCARESSSALLSRSRAACRKRPTGPASQTRESSLRLSQKAQFSAGRSVRVYV